MDHFSKQMVNQQFQMVYDNLKLHLKHQKLLYYECVQVLTFEHYYFLKSIHLLDIFQINQRILLLK